MSDLSKRAQYPQGYWDDQFEYLRQARILQHNVVDKGREYHTVYTGVLTFSFGTVNKAD